MKCTGCGIEIEDVAELITHLLECDGKPEEKWQSYNEYGTDSLPFKHSDNLEEEK